ncbi:MAG: DUF1572 family protein [Planctomycetota bacterium]
MNKYDYAAVLEAIPSARVVFARQKDFAEHCAKQLDDGQFFAPLAPGLNSVGVTMQHMAGNLRSRWTDFLTSDGEKPDRNREVEFAPPGEDLGVHRKQIMQRWERGWSALFQALEQAETADPDATVTIRGVSHSIPMAIARQLDHYGYHVGQIATTARGLVGNKSWEWFTVAPGGSAAFNASLGYKH